MPRLFGYLRALLAMAIVLAPLAGPSRAGSASTPVVPPVHGGTLIDGLFQDPGMLLPNFGGSFYTLLVQQVLFAPLFYSDNHGVIRPGLATDVPTLENGGISSDGRTYTIHLRTGLHWSDGTALTARDVDFSWRLWTDPAVTPFSTLGFDHIQATTIGVDGLTISFRLVSPYAPFVSDWTDTPGILPQHILGLIKPKDVPSSGFALLPNVNSGPFMLAEVRKGDRVVVTRNRFYYGAAQGYPYLDSIVFRTIPSQALLLDALRNHTIDTAWLLPITNLEALRRIHGVTTLALHDPNWEAAFFNLRRPTFADVRVRQALEYGLDRGAELRTVWHGLGSLIGSDQPPSSPVYASDVAPYPYDPARAAKLLDQAGWVLGGDGFRHKGNAILSVTYSTSFNNPWRQADELQALNSWERLGIQVVIRNYPFGVLFNNVLRNGNFDLAEYVSTNVLDPDDSAIFGSRLTPPRGANYGSYSNPDYDRLAGQELTTLDLLQRTAIFHRMQQILHDDVPALWLYSPNDLAGANNRVHNYSPGPYSLETWNAWQWFVTGSAPPSH